MNETTETIRTEGAPAATGAIGQGRFKPIFGSNVVSIVGASARAVSRRQAAEMLGVSEKTIERLINRGELPGFRVGWKWRVMLSDLEAYVSRQQADERKRIGKFE